MKKLLLMVSAVIIVLTSCEKEDSGPKNFNHEEGFKYLSGLNVSDAKMIYQKESSSTRAGGADGGYWKIDLSGKESKLIIKGEDGKNHDITIDNVRKLNDRILMIQPNAREICYLIGAYGLGGDNKDKPYIMVGEEHYTSFVDVKTEKIYKCPSEFNVFGYNKSDSKNNVYFRSPINYKLYKLDVSNFTIQQMLPDGQVFDYFEVTDDGFITYWERENKTFKVKCPEGRIVPIVGNGFVFENRTYSFSGGKIYLWTPVGMNNMEKKEICSVENNLYVDDYLINTYRNAILFKNNQGKYVEFDGVKISESFDISDNFSPYYSNKIVVSNKAWYRNENGVIHKLDMSNYQEKQLPMLDYEIQKLYGDANKSDLMFEGMRYSDGASVFGTLMDNGTIVIDKLSENGSKIINLIPLN